MASFSPFELSFRYRFEAAHRFTKSCADSCATPHGHTWFAEARFGSENDQLNSDDMVTEFSLLKSAFKRFITETVDHSFMHHFNDPILPSLREFIPGFRGLPFPGDPTTELIAALFFTKAWVMQDAFQKPNSARVQPPPREMLIQETPTNSVRFRMPTGTPHDSALINRINNEFEGWWMNPSPEAREIKRRS